MTITYPVGRNIYVNLTNRCPCACTFCLRSNGSGVFGSDPLWLEREPGIDEVAASLDARDLSAVPEVVFCGYGEPTERLDAVLETARHLRRTAPNVKIRLNTNGLGDLIAGRPVAASLKGLVDCVSVSLNTPDPNEYLKVCRPKFGAAAYPALLSFARDAVRAVPEVVLTVVGESVCDAAKQARCRAIAEGIGARLRVRKYEQT